MLAKRAKSSKRLQIVEVSIKLTLSNPKTAQDFRPGFQNDRRFFPRRSGTPRRVYVSNRNSSNGAFGGDFMTPKTMASRLLYR